jgi:protein-S-isoprenylcysteine O-methyltransferase Ste14
MALGNIVMLIVPGLDRIRGGSFHPGIAFKSAALILMIAGYAFSAYALVVNRFFSGVVRIQKERGHKVITEGPYALVRHPGYAGGLLTFLLTPVLLESLWMFLPVIFVSVILIIRTAKEDAFLQRELDGYKEYAGKVKYELIWGVW